jgi:hypothetical protein
MLFRHPLSRLSYSGMVGVAGFEPAITCSQGRWDDQTSLHPSGEGRNRTDCNALAGRVRCLSCHPHAWNCAGSNRGPPRCHRGALPTELQPHAVPRPEPIAPRFGRREWMGGDTELLVVLARAHVNPSRVGHLLVYHAVELSTGLHRACTFTRRWCSAGMAGLEPAPRSFGSCCSGR